MEVLETEAPPPVQTSPPLDHEEESPANVKISGYAPGTGKIVREPSLYLSIAVVFCASWLTLGSNPQMFWSIFGLLSLVAILLHIVAERVIFSAKAAHEKLVVPCEGVFVLTFGAVLPGAGLFAYGLFSWFTTPGLNCIDGLAKLGLLLVVPLFNFLVWSSFRKRYLARPRLTGLMNGLALGLSASWALIWMKCTFLCADSIVACKFGWMLLLFMSPFLFFAAASQAVDLWRKTEPSIARIATTFCGAGVLLSLLFAFAPMGRAAFVESLLKEARFGEATSRDKSVEMLKDFASEEDLRPSENPLSGFALAELLIPGRGLNTSSETDQSVYFAITGKAIDTRKDAKATEWQPDQFAGRSGTGEPESSLSSGRSVLSGTIDARSLTCSVDWTMTLRNIDGSNHVALGEVHLPPGAVLSQTTMWVSGRPQHGIATGVVSRKSESYSAREAREQILTAVMTGPDRFMLSCMVDHSSEAKIRMRVNLPLSSTDGKTFKLGLPCLLSTNFAPPKHHRVQLRSNESFAPPSQSSFATDNGSYIFNSIVKDTGRPFAPIVMKDVAIMREFAVRDERSKGGFIVQRTVESTTFVPKKLFIVLDSSSAMTQLQGQLTEVLSKLPAASIPNTYLVSPSDNENDSEPKRLRDVLNSITAESFQGGWDNGPALTRAMELASEQQGNGVLWIHGAQPIARNLLHSTWPDLINKIHLYDFQIQSGKNVVLDSLGLENMGNLVDYVPARRQAEAIDDLKEFVASLKTAAKSLKVIRTHAKSAPGNVELNAALSERVTALWAGEQAERLMAMGEKLQTEQVGVKYNILTPVTNATVLEPLPPEPKTRLRYADSHWTLSWSSPAGGGGLVGAPVDPRYGQSNEVGMLADYGYDTARDLSRIITFLSLLISIPLSLALLRVPRAAREGTPWVRASALAFGVPVVVHLIGTMLINNYGGLGGGL